MAVPHGTRFAVEFDLEFPQGAYSVGDIVPVTEYQSQEDMAGNQLVRPRIDEATGLRAVDVAPAESTPSKSAAA